MDTPEYEIVHLTGDISDEEWAQIGRLGSQLHEGNDETTQANRELLAAGTQSRLIVARHLGEIVGTTIITLIPGILSEGHAHLSDVIVDEAHRRHGLARLMVASALEWAVEQGAVVIELTSGDHRPEAQQMYLKMGAQEIPTHVFRFIFGDEPAE